MRRVTLWIVSTIATVIVLFSYHTSTNSGTASAALTPVTPGGSSTAPTPRTSASASASSTT